MKQLYDFELNESIELFVLLKNVQQRTTRTDKPYLSIVFQDRSGEMSGNLWEASPEDIDLFTEGQVVFLEGKREEYKGSPQIKVNAMRLARTDEPNEPGQYIKRAPLNKEDMIHYLNDIILDITNPHMNRIVRHILNKHQKSFFEFPAAKANHHAFYGGLAYHTVTMLTIAKSLVDIYPSINQSLLYSGLILHDIGKVVELSGPIGTQYTLEGKLLGHIVVISEEISKACVKLSIDESSEGVLLLKHMVLAHHGQYEYGSPVRPQVREAELLHHIDLIDARMNMLDNQMDKTPPGEFSDNIWALDNRSFYNPKN